MSTSEVCHGESLWDSILSSTSLFPVVHHLHVPMDRPVTYVQVQLDDGREGAGRRVAVTPGELVYRHLVRNVSVVL